MKKIFKMKKMVMFSLLVSMLLGSMQVHAAGPSYNAKYGTPTIDGVVNSNEYGSKVPFNSSNLSLFYYNCATEDPTTANANFPDVTYSFAWDDGNLYVGITAQNISNITDTKFQIDLSPNKKIKDGKAGIFYTFKCISVGSDGLMGISRDNYQNASIARNCKSASREVAGGVYNLEIAIPLSELQVTGNGGNFTDLKLQGGEWGIGCYLIGNDGGYTNTLGAGNNDAVGYNWETGVGSLVQYYNTFTLAAKPATATPDENTNSNTDNNEGQTPSDSAKPDSSTSQNNPQTDNKTEENKGGQNTESDGKTNTSTDVKDENSADSKTEENKDGQSEQSEAETNTSTDASGENTSDDKTTVGKKEDASSAVNKNKMDITEAVNSISNEKILMITIIIAGVMVLSAGIIAFFILRKKSESTMDSTEDRRDSDEKE